MFMQHSPIVKAKLLGALKAISEAGGERLLDIEKECLTAIDRIMLASQENLAIDDLQKASPQELAGILPDKEQREYLVRMMAVMALTGGELNFAKIRAVLNYAAGLDVIEDYTAELEQIVRGDLRAAVEDMTIQNYHSLFPGELNYHEIQVFFMPYQQEQNLALWQRFQALKQLAPETLGHQFWDWYTSRKFGFPGEKDSFVMQFATAHDAAHILAGYDTDAEGEILVSTFTAMMHKRKPMSGHILPVLLTWHLGVDVNGLLHTNKNRLNIEKFWHAWRRGEAMRTDIFGENWDFWQAATISVEDLKKEYGVI